MKKFIFTLALLSVFGTAFSQILKVQYSFEATTDALFFRYDPRVNIPMSSYVGSIRDWTLLVSEQNVDVEEIYDRLDPKFAIIQPRVAGNIHFAAEYLKLSFGVSTGRYEFRNVSFQGEALFRHCFKDACPKLSAEIGFMMIKDLSFGPEAAIRAAKGTPGDIKDKMSRFMTDDLFEKPLSKGLKMGAYWNVVQNLDIGLHGFIDFTKRNDGARNDYASLGIRYRMEQL